MLLCLLLMFFLFSSSNFKEITCVATEGMYNSIDVAPVHFLLYLPSKTTLFSCLMSCNQTCEKNFTFKSKTDNNRTCPCWCPEESMAKWKKHLTFHQKEDGASAWNFLISEKIMYQQLVLLLFCLSWLSSVYIARAHCTCSPGWCGCSWTMSLIS